MTGKDKAARLDAIHRLVRNLLYGLPVLIIAAAGFGCFRIVRSARQQIPRIAPGSAFNDVIQWPWSKFPPVTMVERRAIHEDLHTGEPLIEHSLPLLPWRDVPAVWPLRPASLAARQGVECGFRALRQLLALRAADASPGSIEAEQTEIGLAASCLPDPDSVQSGRWPILYGRGLLYLVRDNPAAAERELREAVQALHLEAIPHRTGDQAVVREAAIYTYYALAQAISRGGRGGSETALSGRRQQAVEDFRQSLLQVPSLWRLHLLDYATPHPLSFFPLRPSGLSTSSLSNDLLAAYLSDPGYHYCGQHPSQPPPCDTYKTSRHSTGSPCDYRDRTLCTSKDRASGDFGPAFTELFQSFYTNDPAAWNEEYRLWALSEAVDRAAENPDLGKDPYLLYNLGALLLELGEFEGAARDLGQAAAAISGHSPELPNADQDRINRLSVIANVLAGKSQRGRSRSSGDKDKSSLRKQYEDLYVRDRQEPDKEATSGDAPDPLAQIEEFPAVGDVFPPPAQALLDRWLFIHLWRTQLAAGDFDGFNREYDRAMRASDQSIPRDFFRGWHDEVLGGVAARARDLADRYRRQGEPGQAKLIDRFLTDSGQIPPGLADPSPNLWNRLLHRVGSSIRIALLLLAGLGLLLLALFSVGLERAYRTTFVSAHRRNRLTHAQRRVIP
ncbi:MAG: hypothetical protein M3O15_01820 [Acidobacteriota bacterium]|nr:hypothetical protein [Acidobacteriota bacterium]